MLTTLLTLVRQVFLMILQTTSTEDINAPGIPAESLDEEQCTLNKRKQLLNCIGNIVIVYLAL